MDCLNPNCQNEVLGDYPLCKDCTPSHHFMNRDDCCCDECTDEPGLRLEYAAEVLQAQQLAEVASFKRITVTTTFGPITPEVIDRLPEHVRLALEEVFAERLEQILREEFENALPQAA